jgi:hypothetical protein
MRLESDSLQGDLSIRSDAGVGGKILRFEIVFKFANIWRIRIPTQKFKFAKANSVSKNREYSLKIQIRIMIVHDVIQHPVSGLMARGCQLTKADRKWKYVSAPKRDSITSGDIINSSQSDRITGARTYIVRM